MPEGEEEGVGDEKLKKVGLVAEPEEAALRIRIRSDQKILTYRDPDK